MGKLGFLCVDCHGAPDHQHPRPRLLGQRRGRARRLLHRLPHGRRAPRHADRGAPPLGRLPDLPHPHLRPEDPDQGHLGLEQGRRRLPPRRPAPLPQDQGRVRLRAGRGPGVPLVRPDRRTATCWATHRPGPRSPSSTRRAARSASRPRPASGRSRSTGRTSPTTSGTATSSRRSPAATDGYWTTFDWESAFRLGAKASGLAYSGKYGFARPRCTGRSPTWSSPKEQALGCNDCHGAPVAARLEGARVRRRSHPDRRPAVRTRVPAASSPSPWRSRPAARPRAAQQPRQPHPPALRAARRGRPPGRPRRGRLGRRHLRRLPRRPLHRRPQRARPAPAPRRPASSATSTRRQAGALPAGGREAPARGRPHRPSGDRQLRRLPRAGLRRQRAGGHPRGAGGGERARHPDLSR